jgi:hypothetical protein
MVMFVEQVCLYRFAYCCDLRFLDHIFENLPSDCIQFFDCSVILWIVENIGDCWLFGSTNTQQIPFAQDILLSNFNHDLHPGQGGKS